MTAISMLATRRSTRWFSDEAVSDELIATVLADAAWAPSAGNLQPWIVSALDAGKSRAFIDRFEDRGWESVFAMLRSVGERERVALARDNAGVVEWFRREVKVRGSPRVVLVGHRPGRLQERAAFAVRALSMAAHRAARQSSLAGGARYLVEMARRVPRDVRIRRDTVTMSVANFAYAFTLSAHARGMATCVQSSYAHVATEIRRFLSLPRDQELTCALLVGFARSDVQPVLEPVRKPVPVTWMIDAERGSLLPR